MNSREKMLVFVVAGVVALFGLKLGYDAVSDMFNDRQQAIAQLDKDIAGKEAQVRAGVNADKRIANWNHRSLPTDKQLAPALYMKWLRGTAEVLGGAKVDKTEATSRGAGDKATFDRFAFRVQGESDLSMKQVVQFLYNFYTANHLQKIRQLTLTPRKDGKLEVVIDVEAILLAGADRKTEQGTVARKDELGSTTLAKLSQGDLSAYETIINKRDLFADYKAPPPAPGPGSGPGKTAPFDVAKYTTLTGIVTENDEPRIFISVKPTGEKFNALKEGDEFTVGGVKYKVLSIGTRDAVLNVEGKRKQLDFGGNLRDAVDLPDEAGL